MSGCTTGSGIASGIIGKNGNGRTSSGLVSVPRMPSDGSAAV